MITAGATDLSLLLSVLAGFGSHPASYTTVAGSNYTMARWLGSDTDHSLPSSAEDRMPNVAFTEEVRMNSVWGSNDMKPSF